MIKILENPSLNAALCRVLNQNILTDNYDFYYLEDYPSDHITIPIPPSHEDFEHSASGKYPRNTVEEDFQTMWFPKVHWLHPDIQKMRIQIYWIEVAVDIYNKRIFFSQLKLHSEYSLKEWMTSCENQTSFDFFMLPKVQEAAYIQKMLKEIKRLKEYEQKIKKLSF